jgi:hypothetical protein
MLITFATASGNVWLRLLSFISLLSTNATTLSRNFHPTLDIFENSGDRATRVQQSPC